MASSAEWLWAKQTGRRPMLLGVFIRIEKPAAGEGLVQVGRLL